jgi:hypothetical protein
MVQTKTLDFPELSNMFFTSTSEGNGATMLSVFTGTEESIPR